MNNFDLVFSAVKDNCGESGIVDSIDCLEKIARSTKIPIARLDFYLNTLEAVGLIKYSMENHFVKLTTYGKLKTKVFTE